MQFVPNAAKPDFPPVGPGQELHILDAEIHGGAFGNGFARAAQVRVKGARLQAKMPDFGFAGDKNKVCAILYHDGRRVHLSVSAASEEVNIEAEAGKP